MADALMLVGASETNQDIYYRSGFLAPDPFIYVENGARRLLVVSKMERGRAEKESSVPEVRTFEDYGYLDLLEELEDRSQVFPTVIERVAADFGGGLRVPASFPVLYADHLRASGFELDIVAELLTEDRRRKSAEEIAAIKAAQRATERAVGRAIDLLAAAEITGDTVIYEGIPLTAERLRGEIEVSLLRDGLDPGTPIVAPGPGAADPHWTGEGPIRPGQSIVIDVFPRDKGTRYFADMTRTVVKGEPPPALQAMYDAVLRAQAVALAAIRPGVQGSDVHKAVEESFKQDGYDENSAAKYIHGTGHGVGLDIHEGPSLGRAGRELKAGDVVTVEPGLYDADLGAVRIEDLVVVTADGNTDLTDFPKVFRV